MAKSGVKTIAQPQPIPTWKKVTSGVLIGLGMITFFLAQSTVWVTNTFFDEENFVGTVEEVLKTEESREAIASTIVQEAFKNNPVAEQLIGKQVTAILTGFLDSEQAAQLFDRVAHRSYAYLTSSNREDIAINLTAIKDPLTRIVTIAENRGREVKFDPSNIPDTITIVESDSLPNVSGYMQLVLFASGFLWFLTVASFGTYLYLNRQRMIHGIYVVGWSIIAVCAVAVLSGPFVPPAIASLVNLISIRGVVEDLTKALIEPFTVQLLSTAVVTSFVLLLVSLRGSIRLGLAKLVNLFK
jgi:hypothetical protein